MICSLGTSKNSLKQRVENQSKSSTKKCMMLYLFHVHFGFIFVGDLGLCSML